MPNSSSCIDLIFTDQPNLVVDSGVHPSLHPNCHHQITYCKFNLFIEYPPPYERQVWDYDHADTSSIKKSLNQINWNQLFQNKNVNEQVAILNNIILNIFSNFVPNKILTFDDRDPPWMTEYIKSKIHWKNCIYNQYVNSLRNHVDYDILQQAISEVSELVDNAKNNYYNLANTLSNPSSSSKTYWSILKLFCNNKKIPLIPPILVGNKLESDFKLKANYFNKYFASKCTPMNNDSSLSSSFEFYSQSRLSSRKLLKIIP